MGGCSKESEAFASWSAHDSSPQLSHKMPWSSTPGRHGVQRQAESRHHLDVRAGGGPPPQCTARACGGSGFNVHLTAALVQKVLRTQISVECMAFAERGGGPREEQRVRATEATSPGRRPGVLEESRQWLWSTRLARAPAIPSLGSGADGVDDTTARVSLQEGSPAEGGGGEGEGGEEACAGGGGGGAHAGGQPACR